MFTAMMSTELEATGHMQREFKRSKGSSCTQEWHLYRFSELMDTHGGKTSTSECNEAALLHVCYIFANDLHCGQWPQSRIDDDKRGSRSEFCNKKVAGMVIKRGKWPPQMWDLPKGKLMFPDLMENFCISGTQEWHIYRFSELMNTHGGKTSTSECTETALLHFCYIFANDLQCGQWPQSRLDDDKRGSRSEFCNKKGAKRVIKRGKWPPQMWVLPKEN